jgi:hypothetical protein
LGSAFRLLTRQRQQIFVLIHFSLIDQNRIPRFETEPNRCGGERNGATSSERIRDTWARSKNENDYEARNDYDEDSDGELYLP